MNPAPSLRTPNRYAQAAWLLAAAITGLFVYALAHMPPQASDMVGELLGAQASPSAWITFLGNLNTAAYFRPWRLAQIKLAFDAARGHYVVAFVAIHLALLVVAVALFTGLHRVRTLAGLAALAIALTVLFGLHTTRGTLWELYPINHFLEIAAFALLVFAFSTSRGGWWADAGSCIVLAFGLMTLESGVLIWVVLVAARLVGYRGVSTRAVAVATLLLVGYLGIRAMHVGMPTLIERASGVWLERLEPPELVARYGHRLSAFYGYNIAAAFFSLLTSEPRAGVFAVGRYWVAGEVPAWVWINIGSSVLTTLMLAGFAMTRVRRWFRWDLADVDRVVLVAGAVVCANALVSYPYLKDEILSTGGVFYALATGAVVRHLLQDARPRRGAAAAALGVVLLVIGSLWTVRTVGTAYSVRDAARRNQADWVNVMLEYERPDQPPLAPDARRLIEQMRTEILRMAVPTDRPLWAEKIFDRN